MMAVVALELGDIADSVRIATEGQAAGRASATPWVRIVPFLSRVMAMHEGDFDRAGRLHEEALELVRRQGESGVWVSSCSTSRCSAWFSDGTRRPGLCRRGHCSLRRIRRPTWHRLVPGGSLGRPGGGRTCCTRGSAPGRNGGSARERRRTGSSHLQQVDWQSLLRRREGLSGRALASMALAEGRAISFSQAIQFGLENAAN